MTKFYLLNSLAGWREAEIHGVSYSIAKDGVCLDRKPRAIKDKIGTFAGLDLPTGFAFDHFGNIYIVDTDRNVILKYDLCQEFPSPLPYLGRKGKEPGEFDAPIGIAISPSGNLYISDSNNHRIQVFSLKGFILRDTWGKKDASGFPGAGSLVGELDTPWDLALDSKENVYVVDKGNHRIQKFSKTGTFIAEFGQAQLSNPEHIVIDTQDRIYVTDDKPNVQVFNSNGEHLREVENRDQAAENFTSPPIWVDNAGRIHYSLNIKFLQDPGAGVRRTRPIRGGIVSEDVFHFFTCTCNLHLSPLAKRAPGRRRQKDCEYSLVEGIIPGAFYKDDKLVFAAENLPGPVDDVIEYKKEGTFYTEALDSQTYKCQWHKVLLEADIPLGTGITVETYTSESKKDILEIKALSSHLWQTRQLNAKNFLVQSPPGRYLWLRITFNGNGKESPLIKNIKIFYPRVSYLQYLPAIYQDEPHSKWFLERFLSIFEHFFSGYEQEIAGIARYFNPMSTEKEFLPWIASWLGLVPEENVPDKTKRPFIKQAHQLFKMRGTLKGLQKVLKIYTGGDFLILEHFKIRQWLILGEKTILGGNSYLWGNESSLGESTQLGNFKLGDMDTPRADPFNTHAHRFTVIIPDNYCNNEEKERIIKRVVELWKPAHTQFFLRRVKPGFKVGLQSMIGADTIIAKYPQAVLGQVSRLGKESILSSAPGESGAPGFVLNKTIRLNKDSIID
jgi:phage tail-like protein